MDGRSHGVSSIFAVICGWCSAEPLYTAVGADVAVVVVAVVGFAVAYDMCSSTSVDQSPTVHTWVMQIIERGITAEIQGRG